jgi:octaprenyl-diphosphate synthase
MTYMNGLQEENLGKISEERNPLSDYHPFLGPIEGDLAVLEGILSQEIDSPAELICRVATYVLRSRGKRIRPALLLLSARICGYVDGSRHVKLASIGEYLHVATLIHDDIIDNSEMRRGKPSANYVWGNSLSVLVGDYLYSRSVKYLVEDEDLEVMRAFVDATLRMVEGEVLQQEMSGKSDISPDMYLNMITRKTASLFSACCRVGAVISGAPPDRTDALGSFGLDLGIAFQIMDDALDFVGDERRLGKPAGKDLREGRITFPLIYILKQGSEADRELVSRFFATPEKEESQVAKILSLVEKYRAVQWARGVASDYAEKAKGHLTLFSNSEAKQSLLELVDYTLARDW